MIERHVEPCRYKRITIPRFLGLEVSAVQSMQLKQYLFLPIHWTPSTTKIQVERIDFLK